MKSISQKVSERRLRQRVRFPGGMDLRDWLDTEEPGQGAIANFQASVEADLEAYRSQYTSAQSSLRTAMIINAGAAIALLAFLGNLWPLVEERSVLEGFVNSLLAFVLGVTLGAAGIAAHHFMHHFVYSENNRGITIAKWTFRGLLFSSFAAFAVGGKFVHSALLISHIPLQP